MALTRDLRKELKFKAMSPFALCFDNYAIDPSILSKRQATRTIAAAERKDLQCLDEDADAIMTAMLGSMLTPKSRPRLYEPTTLPESQCEGAPGADDCQSAPKFCTPNNNRGRGTERIGLVASSNGMRLKPVGVFVKAKIEPATWFLAGKDDVRSSYALEDVATEFDIQGLELDWVGMCWDANFRREDNNWKPYYFRGARWERVQDPTRAAYLANAYRVLLTRARQGMVILVPRGTELDQTRTPSFYDETFSFLSSCGIPEFPSRRVLTLLQ